MKMQQKHIRLPKNQMEWLETKKGVYGSEAMVIRILIDEAMKREALPKIQFSARHNKSKNKI